MLPTGHTHRIARRALLAAAASVALAAAAPAAAAPLAHGQLVRIVRPRGELNANQSDNWFGYNQGTLEQNGKQFHAISGEWKVPKASQHVKGQSESSSDWIGIGGGCIDAGCSVGDNTLIQAGTEQDVDSSGSPSYSAWYELVPAPSFAISGMTIDPGDLMSATIAETPNGSEMWSISLDDLTRGESFQTTLPYSSDYATAEWIEEVPVVVNGASSGIAPLPNLSTIPFDHATTNGQPANLNASEEMQLTDQNGDPIGTPSAPDAERDGFNLCSWATSCAAPTVSESPASSAATAGGGSAAGLASAPSRRLAVRSRTVRVKGRRVRLELWSSVASRGTLKLLAATGRRGRRTKAVLGEASFVIADGGSDLVSVRLSPKALKLLARDATLKVRATVAATYASGGNSTISVGLKLRRAAHQR